MKLVFTVFLIIALAPASLNAQQKPPPAAPLLSSSICGKGVFLFWLGDQSIGREEFEIRCQPDGGYAASGHTDLKASGATLDLGTTFEVDKSEKMRKAVQDNDSSASPDPMRSAWMKYFLQYDPLPTIRRVRQPILILQGELDRQVTADQAEMLAKAAREAGNRHVTALLFPGLNHLFLPAKTGAPFEYSSLSTTTIPDDVIKQLVDWLVEKLSVKKR